MPDNSMKVQTMFLLGQVFPNKSLKNSIQKLEKMRKDKKNKYITRVL